MENRDLLMIFIGEDLGDGTGAIDDCLEGSERGGK